MTRVLKTAMGALALTAVGVLGAGSAFAAAPSDPTVPYTPDPNSIGGIHFYNSSGTLITTGSLSDHPFAAYAVAEGGAIHAGDDTAILAGYQPQAGVNPGLWSGDFMNGGNTFPAAGEPAAAAGKATSASGATDFSLSDLFGEFAVPTTGADAGLYEMRIFTSNSGGGGTNTATYYSADLKITGSTWTQVDPAAPAGAPATTTSLAAAPSSPQNVGTSLTFTATVTSGSPAVPVPNASGTVQFMDGATALGSPVSVGGGNGTAPFTTSALTAGDHSITAVFTPTNPALFSGSTSSAVPYHINGPATATTTGLAVTPTTGPAFAPVTFTASVTPTSAVGSVQFLDGATSLGSSPVSAGGATLTVGTLGQGAHSFTAVFTPTNPANFQASTSPIVTANYTAPTGPAPDNQPITVTVPAGALSISTPYTATNPLNLGTMALNAQGTALSATGAFGSLGSGTDPLATEIKVVDTRSGSNPWTLSASSAGGLTSGANSIDGKFVGLTALTPDYLSGNAIQSIVVTNRPANDPSNAADPNTGLKTNPTIASKAAPGIGSVGIHGTLTINAPTSTQPGTYAGSIVFTIA